MNEIKLLIAKSFGLALSDEQIEVLISWYRLKNISTVDKLRTELTSYLYTKYKGKMIALFEEDTSNLQYLLSLLDKKVKER